MKLRIKKTILLSFICLLFANSVFAQVNPQERMINRMRESGLSDNEIEVKVNQINNSYQEKLKEEFNKIQNIVDKENINSQNQRLTCTDIPASEKEVLQAIYDNLNGASWAVNWDFNTPVTSWNSTTQTGWYGVKVDYNCNIIGLSLSSDNITGVFPDISNLINLQDLFISTGVGSYSQPYKLTGDFSSIGNLINLKRLTLNNANFSGSLPSSFSNLNLLEYLSLGHCNLSDYSQLCNIVSEYEKLTTLSLMVNFYTGTLPSCFNSTNLPYLKSILMSGNNFSDISTLSNFSSLEDIWFSNNDIQGVIPDLSSNLNLHQLTLEFNNLEGQIPGYFSSRQFNSLVLDWNKLRGSIPLIQRYSFSYDMLHIYRNNFVFKDFENIFTQLNDFNLFLYAPQAKTDNIINDDVFVASSYTMTMHENGNDSSLETYQWYKGIYPTGTAIAGANSRQYTIPSLQLSDSGSYYCLSTHPIITMTSNVYKNLILQREPIKLNVVNNCPPLNGEIFLKNSYQCGINFMTPFGFSNYSSLDSYSWSITNPLDNIVFNSSIPSPSFTFTDLGTNIIDLIVTKPDGCSYQFSKNVHITLCNSCTTTNPNTSQIQSLLVDFLEYIIQKKINGALDSELEGTLPQELVLLSPYITDANPRIYNFQSTFNGYNQLTGFSFSFSPNSPNNIVIAGGNFSGINSSNFQFDLSSYNDANIGINIVDYPYGQFYIKNGMINHIEFCPDETISCTATNPNTPVVKQLFINLINHLITLPSVPNGYTCPELTLLAPYVQPYNPVAIYNFSNGSVAISFSFVNNGSSSIPDIQIPYNAPGNTIIDINLSNYSNYDTKFNVDTQISDGYIDTNKGYVKNIEFCPDELFCKNHIAIVVDESGSIDEREARKIRAQLKSFIEQQALINETTGTNTHVSLIGLSDSDTYNRPDHKMGNSKLTNTNKSDYLDWINLYRTNRIIPVPGISPNSDYWKSGLSKALEGNPDLVILITDGCQTSNAGALKDFIRTSFNNNSGASSNPNAPHLYVVGLDNGFYVDSDTALNRSSKITTSEDPNLNPSLQRSAGENSRVTSYLRTSLKYLMQYPSSEFPVNDKYNFIFKELTASTPPVTQMVDYFGATDFDFLSDEPNYIYNGSVRAEVSCGVEIDLKECDTCLNFKPTPGKEYIVSAWVKEELKVQVKNYTNGEVHIRFLGNTNNFIGSEIIATTSGDIIDDWQRIFKRFVIPSDTHYIEISLVNNSGTVPVYFDDVRIHPIDGSMKSFVYDPETFRLMSELDENNFSTFYEYDNEGGLIRVKKETSRGIKTIQETRSGNVIKVE